MAGYVYRGTEFDAKRPLAKPKQRKKYEWGDAQCGTYAGYDQHRHNQEPICEPCAEARREYQRDWRERVRERQGRPRRTKAPCGTHAGYGSHQRKKEPACQPCRDAHNAYNREYVARKKKAA